jgi:hypothetical protein
MQKNEKIFQKICKNHKNGIFLPLTKSYFRAVAFFSKKKLAYIKKKQYLCSKFPKNKERF